MEEEVSEVGGYKIVGENEERDIALFQPLCSRFCLAAFSKAVRQNPEQRAWDQG